MTIEQRMQKRLERLSVLKANVYHVGRTNTPIRISQVTNVLRPLVLGNSLDHWRFLAKLQRVDFAKIDSVFLSL